MLELAHVGAPKSKPFIQNGLNISPEFVKTHKFFKSKDNDSSLRSLTSLLIPALGKFTHQSIILAYQVLKSYLIAVIFFKSQTRSTKWNKGQNTLIHHFYRLSIKHKADKAIPACSWSACNPAKSVKNICF